MKGTSTPPYYLPPTLNTSGVEVSGIGKNLHVHHSEKPFIHGITIFQVARGNLIFRGTLS